MPKVRIYRKEATKRDFGILIACVIESNDDWDTFDDLSNFYRIDPNCIAERRLTDSEEQDAYIWRFYYYSYPSWEVLIKHEWKTTYDLEWVTKLFQISGLPGSINDLIKNT